MSRVSGREVETCERCRGAGSENPVRTAARALSIPVVEAVVGDHDPAGAFRLFETEADATPASADNEALVLHTSGTTSRPKVVPLMQRNIMASARNIAASLKLTDSDHWPVNTR